MKKIKFMRLASVLLVLCLLTTCAVSGTFAKYTTSDTGNDTARVAKFGVKVAVDQPSSAIEDAFVSTYETQDSDVSATIANSVKSTADVIAPGTSGTLVTAAISGMPEVAVNVKIVGTLELSDWVVNTTYYCPLVFTIDGTAYYGNDYADAAAFIAAVNGALSSDDNYAPNEDLTESHSVTWAWAFEKGTAEHFNNLNDNVKDTALGDAATAATVKLTYTITVTQID